MVSDRLELINELKNVVLAPPSHPKHRIKTFRTTHVLDK